MKENASGRCLPAAGIQINKVVASLHSFNRESVCPVWSYQFGKLKTGSQS